MPIHHPGQPRLPAAVRADADTGLTDELSSVLAGARRRALRDGDRQLDTAHLLHSLIEADPEVRAALGEGARVARVLGYLVQRSIGYGLRWQGSVEDSGALPAARALGARAGPGAGAPGWSPSAAAAMEGARARARARGEGRAAGVDLLARLAMDPGCRAVEVLRRAGVDTGQLGGRMEVG